MQIATKYHDQLSTNALIDLFETFKSFEECKQLLVKHYQDDLVHGLLKNLTLYGTGRKPDVAGLDEIRDIQARLRSKGYRLGDLVKAVVQSEAFLGDQ